MFIDSVKIYVKAGKGGDGIVAFRREKYVPKGGPAGGNGGRGGSVIFVGDSNLTTLLDLHYRKHIIAGDGQNGMSKNKFGRDGEDIIIKVPLGTTVTDLDRGVVIADVTTDGQQIVIASGGKGGKGNAAFATPRVPAPYIFEKGDPGEEFNLKLDLKVLADIGLVGFPSVGKSTLISVISEAKPKIADYPFTTLKPNLGVVQAPDGRSFVVADLPGLIEGAHLGAGLGIEFLKHIERTRVIVHIVDMGSLDGRDPYQDYLTINKELESYDMELLERPQIIVANKMDLPESEENLKRFKELVKEEVIPISAATKENISTLLYKIADTLDEVRAQEPKLKINEQPVEYTYQEPEADFTITRDEDGVFNVTGPTIKKLFDRTDFNFEENAKLFARRIRNLGVDAKLRELGVKTGDIVRIFDYEFEFIE